jgi:regulator-associated protein of mTOR
VRAIVLLRRFLSLGPWAVNLALSVGIFPYVLKLLQSPAPELRQILVAIWSKILAFDSSCQVDLVKDDAHGHFISHLNWQLTPPPNPANPASLHQLPPNPGAAGDPSAAAQRVMAAFVLAAIVHDYPVGQQECLNKNLHGQCVALLAQTEHTSPAVSERIQPQFRMWLCIVLAELMKGFESAQLAVYHSNNYLRLYARLNDGCSEVRASACYAIAMLLGGLQSPQQQQQQQLQQQHLTEQQQRQQQQRDEQRLPLDIVSARALVAVLDDGSPIVRYEATVGLGSMVGKYLNMFATVANQMMKVGREPNSGASVEPGSPLTPAPLLEDEAGSPERRRTRGSRAESGDGEEDLENDEEEEEDVFGLGLESTINEETAEDFAFVWTALRGIQHTDPHPNVCSAALAIVQTVHERVLYLQCRQAELKQARRDEKRRLREEQQEQMRRSESGQLEEGSTPPGSRHTLSNAPRFASAATLSQATAIPPDPLSRVASAGMVGGGGKGGAAMEQPMFQTYQLPVTGFYEWKREAFGKESDEAQQGRVATLNKLDPLSVEGSLKSYRKRRDSKVHAAASALAKKYAHLIPKPKGGLDSATNDNGDFEGDTGSGRGSGAKDKKSSIKMDQSAVLDNDSDMTSNILFHPYENFLVVCDDFDQIALWNFDSGKKELSFSNCNKNGSRMTSVKWLNDSILAVGCCDGTVRLWDSVINSPPPVADMAPASAFFAAPDMTAGQRGSGLVMEWLDWSQTLICSGNSSMVRCWDMEKEQVVRSFATGSDVCLTCLTNACDKDEGGAYVDAAQGPFGPDVVVCGFGDGALRVFDLRAPSKAVMSYHEHGSWIVNSAFTTFGGRPELLTGCISGDCKFWDLRLPASLRNLDVQRSPMTAFAVHKQVPLIASGAHAQFLKVLDFEGETKNVIRYHEGFLGQRIGAVSCLAYHPYKLLLAAGATDPFISLYSQGE